MNKIVGIVERILRIIMFVVAVAMLGGALFLLGLHQTNKNLEKIPVSGKIVYGTEVKAIHEVTYSFEGKEHQKRPLDIYFRKLGDDGKKITVYVAKDHPTRIFISKTGRPLIDSAGLIGGWSLVLLLILFGEHQLLRRMKMLEENSEK